MKQAIALLFLSFAFVCVVFGSIRSGGVANAQIAGVCPSPAPSCTTSGTLSHISGTYACSRIETDSDNTSRVAIMLFTSNGAGSGTALMAENDNSTSPTTFQDFAKQTGLSYCVNTDDTGYTFPPAGKGCPLPFVIDNGNGAAHSEVRLLDSTENMAQLWTCKKQ